MFTELLCLYWLVLVMLQAIKHRKYSSSSDIWSYGIVVHEIWSLGERPYGTWSNRTVQICTSPVY